MHTHTHIYIYTYTYIHWQIYCNIPIETCTLSVVVLVGDGSPTGLWEGEEHRCVQLQHPAAEEASRSVQGATCCQSGATI